MKRNRASERGGGEGYKGGKSSDKNHPESRNAKCTVLSRIHLTRTFIVCYIESHRLSPWLSLLDRFALLLDECSRAAVQHHRLRPRLPLRLRLRSSRSDGPARAPQPLPLHEDSTSLFPSYSSFQRYITSTHHLLPAAYLLTPTRTTPYHPPHPSVRHTRSSLFPSHANLLFCSEPTRCASTERQ
jgi:hypothetical protein